MANIPLYQQQKLASSRVGVPEMPTGGLIMAKNIISNTQQLSNAEMQAGGQAVANQLRIAGIDMGAAIQSMHATAQGIQETFAYEQQVRQRQAQIEEAQKKLQDTAQAALEDSKISQGISDQLLRTKQQYEMNPEKASKAFDNSVADYIQNYENQNPVNSEVSAMRTARVASLQAQGHDTLNNWVFGQRNEIIKTGLQEQLGMLTAKGADGYTPDLSKAIADLKAPLTMRFGESTADKMIIEAQDAAAKNFIYSNIANSGDPSISPDAAIQKLDATKALLEGKVFTSVIPPRERMGLLQDVNTQLKAQDERKARSVAAADLHNDLNVEDIFLNGKHTTDPIILSSSINQLNKKLIDLQATPTPNNASEENKKLFEKTKLGNERDLSNKIEELKNKQEAQGKEAEALIKAQEAQAHMEYTEAKADTLDELARRNEAFRQAKDEQTAAYYSQSKAALRNDLHTALDNMALTKEITGSNADLKAAFAAGIALSRASKAGALVGPDGDMRQFDSAKKLISTYLQHVAAGGALQNPGHEKAVSNPFVPGEAQDRAIQYLHQINKLPPPEWHKILNPNDDPGLKDRLIQGYLKDVHNGADYWQNKVGRPLELTELSNIQNQAQTTAMSDRGLEGMVPPPPKNMAPSIVWSPTPEETKRSYAERLATAVNTKAMTKSEADKLWDSHGGKLK